MAGVGAEAKLVFTFGQVAARAFVSTVGTVWLPITHQRQIYTSISQTWAPKI